MHALPRAKPPTRALGCLALHTRGSHSASHWTGSAHALAPPSPSGSPRGRSTAGTGPCSSGGPSHAAAPFATTAASAQAAAASTGYVPGVRCWATCSRTAPLSLPLAAGSAIKSRRACCPGAGPLSSAWPCRCVPGPRLGPGVSEPPRHRIDQRLTPGAEARGGGGSGSGTSGGSSSSPGIGTSVFLASVAASAAAASVGTNRALAGVAALSSSRRSAPQLRPLPSTTQPCLRAPSRSPPTSPVPRPAVPTAAAPASAASGGASPTSSASPSPSSSASASRRSPLVFVGSGGSSGSSSSSPSGRAVAAAGPTQMAALEAAVASGAVGSSWPPTSERLEAVAARLRAQPRVQHKPVSDRAAAVLVGLFEDSSGVVRVLLTQRSSRLKSHRGEVCLPGGKRDEEDADDAATALREANEELGLDPSSATVLCCLPPVLSKHHLSVTPVLALLAPGAVPAPHPAEVDAAFTVPLAVFLGTYADPRRPAGGGAGAAGGDTAGRQQQAASATAPPPPAPADDGGDSSGRRTRRRRSAAAAAGDSGPAAAAAAAAAAADAEPKPLSWRPPPASSSKSAPAPAAAAAAAAAAVAAAAEGAGAGPGARSIGSDCVYGNAVHEYRDISWGDHEYRIHSFQYGDFDVWGLTATICIAAARLALGREPSFQERCPGGQHYSCFYWDGTALRVRPEAEIAHSDAARAAAATATAAAAATATAAPGAATGAGLAVAEAARESGQAGEGGVLQLPSREDLAAAADVAVEAVEEEVVILASGPA